MSKGYVYILTNFKRSTIYIGVTNSINSRIYDHKQGKGSKLTKKYKLSILVYAEEFDNISDAIAREKQLKNWHSDWKWNLVKTHNPKLVDWYEFLRG